MYRLTTAMDKSQRDLVFFSYRHDKDGERWLKTLQSMLAPYVLGRHLIDWSDRDIRTGEQWHVRIQSAIERTRVAVLLVNQGFFGSAYIREHELPRLVDYARAGHLKLIVVVVGFVDRELMDAHGLSDFQAADALNRPLNGLRGGNLDRALVAVAIKVREAYAGVAEKGAVPGLLAEALRYGDAPQILGADAALGPLLDVPAYDPARFVARPDDIAALREILVEGTELALGVTSAGPGVGLHGMGGMGKSVLALALCHDDALRRAFPAGIAWVALGQTPDLLAVQNRLMRLLDPKAQPAETQADGGARLRQTLRDRRALLVVDDVWDAGHVQALDIGQGRSRMLMTTRDASVLSLAGARTYGLQRLPRALARDLIALRAHCRVHELPPEADEVIEHTGGLPLALALAGAQIADGVSWKTVVDELRQGHVDFLDHAYGSIYASLGRSVDALNPADRERYLDLAVFPEDDSVPMSVVARLWQHRGNLSAAQAEQLLVRLDRKALLTLTGNGAGRTVALHDLQLDFVRWRAPDPAALHRALLDVIREAIRELVRTGRYAGGADQLYRDVSTLVQSGEAHGVIAMLEAIGANESGHKTLQISDYYRRRTGLDEIRWPAGLQLPMPSDQFDAPTQHPAIHDAIRELVRTGRYAGGADQLQRDVSTLVESGEAHEAIAMLEAVGAYESGHETLQISDHYGPGADLYELRWPLGVQLPIPFDQLDRRTQFSVLFGEWSRREMEAGFAMLNGETSTAQAIYEECLARAQQIDVSELVARSHKGLARVAGKTSQRSLERKHLELAMDAHEPALSCDTRRRLATISGEDGELQEADEALTALIERIERDLQASPLDRRMIYDLCRCLLDRSGVCARTARPAEALQDVFGAAQLSETLKPLVRIEVRSHLFTACAELLATPARGEQEHRCDHEAT